MGFWVGEKHVYLDFEGYYREEGSIYGFRWSMLVYFGGGNFKKLLQIISGRATDVKN